MEIRYNYSVIIPHKNSLPTLRRALASIPSRPDIQIILVDNSDLPIIQEDISADVELHFSDPLKGAGHARNLGLSFVKGKWILFLDSDDFFTANAFDCFDQYLTSKGEIIFFSICTVFSDNLLPVKKDSYLNQQIVAFLNKVTQSEKKLRFRHYPPWAKMISSHLVRENGVTFDATKTSNDVMFSAKIGHMASSITASSEVVYCYTVRQGSLTLLVNKEALMSKFQVLLAYNTFLLSVNQGDLRVPISYYLLRSLSYGFGSFREASHLARLNKTNLFIEIKYFPREVLKYFFKKRFRRYEVKG